ncbi:MAG: hypothetical protein WCJ29_06415, partial [bacterium]
MRNSAGRKFGGIFEGLKSRLLAVLLFSVFAFSVFAPQQIIAATVPHFLNYQARVTDASGTAVANGSLNVKIALYTSASGASGCVWSAGDSTGDGTDTVFSQSADCPSHVPSTAISVTVTNGIFSVVLGDTAAGQNAIDETIFNSGNIYLGLTIGADTEMTPRKLITASAYAFNSERLDGLDTSASGGTGAFVPVTNSNGLLTLTGNSTTSDAVFTINSAAASNELLLGLKTSDASKFTVDAEGDTYIAGSVGIGTLSPGVALDVNGAIRSGVAGTDGQLRIYSEQGATDYEVIFNPHATMTQDVTYTLPANDGDASQFLQTDGSGALTWATAGGALSGLTTNYIPRATSSSAIGNSGLIDDGTQIYTTTRNVGVGRAVPNGKLDVAGSVDSTDGLVFYQTADNKSAIQTYLDGAWATRSSYGLASNHLLLQPDAGRVGIGTTAPSQTFAVGSSTNSYFTVDGANGNTVVSGTLAANGGITFDSSSDTIGAHTAGGTIDMSSNIITNIGHAGTDFVASTGALNLAGVLTANNGAVITAAAVGSTAENILSLGVSDSTSSVALKNGASADGTFLPIFYGINNDDARSGLGFTSNSADAQYAGVWVPSLRFTAGNRSGSPLTAQPLFGVENSGSWKFVTWFDGRTKITGVGETTYPVGAVRPTAQLQVIGADTSNSSLAADIAGSSGTGLVVTNAGNIGIGDTAPASKFTVGSGSLFQVNSSGNIVKINNVTTSFPASQGAAGSVLLNDGSGNLSWAASTATGFWNRATSTLSPANAGDAITTTGNISTTSTGTITSAGLLTASSGLTVTSGNISVSGANITGASPLSFDGSTPDAVKTIFAITDPTGTSKTINVPN